MKIRTIFLQLTTLLAVELSLAEENCDIPNDEIAKMSHIIHNVNQTVDSVETYKGGTEECNQLVNNIYTHLQKLTEKYELMHKSDDGQDEKQEALIKDYEIQLDMLMRTFEELKEKSNHETSFKVTQLQQHTAELEGDASEMLTKQRAKLCLKFLWSNQTAKAKQLVAEMNSVVLQEVIEKAIAGSGGSVTAVIDLCTAIPNVDDREVAYQKIYKLIKGNTELHEDFYVLLEATLLKMSEKRDELKSIQRELSMVTGRVLEKWIIDIEKSEKLQLIGGVMEHMHLSQMKYLGEKISTNGKYDTVRNFLRLAVVSNNNYKLAAYKELAKKRVLSGLTQIMFDMIYMKERKLKQDHHVPEEVTKLFKETMDLLPQSLKTIAPCYKRVYIRNYKQKECIAVEREKDPAIIGKVTLGEYTRVITDTRGCTHFRLHPTDDRVSLRIVSRMGEPLTNMNMTIWWDPSMAFVGAAYADKSGKTLKHSTDWLLEANYDNDTIKIKSEFNAYKKEEQRTEDHLLMAIYKNIHSLFVRRHGYRGLMESHVKKFADWTIQCV